jgi:BlaI family penicillinase repressor
MSSVSKIMESEYEIMKVLWNESPLTANEIYAVLTQKMSWSKSTAITLMNRLVEKGALNSVKRGVYFYTPIVSEAEYTRYHADNFLKKMFNGNAKNLLADFCDHEGITIEDLNEIKQMIARKEM